MPEGHTLFRLAREVSDRFAGRRVAVTSPQGRFAESASLVDGTLLVHAESFGKHLFVEFEHERHVHVHLGLYGRFDLDDAPPPPPVGQVRMRLVSPTSYGDLRGATACELLTLEQRSRILARLGPDPLRDDADWTRAWDRVRHSRAPVGGLLMDQAVLSGVGNVYRAEVLFRHRLDPWMQGRELAEGQWEAIWGDLVVLLKDGVRRGRIVTTLPQDRPHRSGTVRRDEAH
jgi:endonuclease VIII